MEEPSKYQIYFLRRNPFPAVGFAPYYDPDQIDEALSKFCETARKDELTFIREKFVKVAMEGQSINVWLEGDIGVGKTALLIKCWDELRRKGNIVAIYAPIFEGMGSEGFYKGWVRELGIDFFEDLAYRLLQRAFIEKVDTLLSHLDPDRQKEVKAKIVDAVKGDYKILRQIFYRTKKIEIKELAFINKEQLLQQFEYWLAAIPGLVCKRLVSSTRGNPAIIPLFLEDPEEAFKQIMDLYPPKYAIPVLQDIISLVNKAGYIITFLFIDQLDLQWQRAGWSKAKKDKIVLELRNLVANVIGKVAIATTTYPELSPQFRGDPDLMSVLPMTPERVCVVGRLGKEAVRDVFATYLRSERTKEDVPELMPFTIDAIDEITLKSAGNIRQILVAAHDILSRAADEKVKQIDINYIKKYYEPKK
jgi:hypothetical protein